LLEEGEVSITCVIFFLYGCGIGCVVTMVALGRAMDLYKKENEELKRRIVHEGLDELRKR
jgi:hypothetical protein